MSAFLVIFCEVLGFRAASSPTTNETSCGLGETESFRYGRTIQFV